MTLLEHIHFPGRSTHAEHLVAERDAAEARTERVLSELGRTRTSAVHRQAELREDVRVLQSALRVRTRTVIDQGEALIRAEAEAKRWKARYFDECFRKDEINKEADALATRLQAAERQVISLGDELVKAREKLAEATNGAAS